MALHVIFSRSSFPAWSLFVGRKSVCALYVPTNDRSVPWSNRIRPTAKPAAKYQNISYPVSGSCSNWVEYLQNWLILIYIVAAVECFSYKWRYVWEQSAEEKAIEHYVMKHPPSILGDCTDHAAYVWPSWISYRIFVGNPRWREDWA
jgi:hypothetical protein